MVRRRKESSNLKAKIGHLGGAIPFHQSARNMLKLFTGKLPDFLGQPSVKLS